MTCWCYIVRGAFLFELRTVGSNVLLAFCSLQSALPFLCSSLLAFGPVLALSSSTLWLHQDQMEVACRSPWWIRWDLTWSRSASALRIYSCHLLSRCGQSGSRMSLVHSRCKNLPARHLLSLESEVWRKSWCSPGRCHLLLWSLRMVVTPSWTMALWLAYLYSCPLPWRQPSSLW